MVYILVAILFTLSSLHAGLCSKENIFSGDDAVNSMALTQAIAKKHNMSRYNPPTEKEYRTIEDTVVASWENVNTSFTGPDDIFLLENGPEKWIIQIVQHEVLQQLAWYRIRNAFPRMLLRHLYCDRQKHAQPNYMSAFSSQDVVNNVILKAFCDSSKTFACTHNCSGSICVDINQAFCKKYPNNIPFVINHEIGHIKQLLLLHHCVHQARNHALDANIIPDYMQNIIYNVAYEHVLHDVQKKRIKFNPEHFINEIAQTNITNAQSMVIQNLINPVQVKYWQDRLPERVKDRISSEISCGQYSYDEVFYRALLPRLQETDADITAAEYTSPRWIDNNATESVYRLQEGYVSDLKQFSDSWKYND